MNLIIHGNSKLMLAKEGRQIEKRHLLAKKSPNFYPPPFVYFLLKFLIIGHES